jgi:hypothetical protein
MYLYNILQNMYFSIILYIYIHQIYCWKFDLISDVILHPLLVFLPVCWEEGRTVHSVISSLCLGPLDGEQNTEYQETCVCLYLLTDR